MGRKRTVRLRHPSYQPSQNELRKPVRLRGQPPPATKTAALALMSRLGKAIVSEVRIDFG